MSTSRTSHARRVIRAGRLQLPRPRGAALLQPGALTAVSLHIRRYYNSKGLLSDGDAKEALDGFKEVVKMEDEKGEWGFKAHKQMVRPRPAVAGEWACWRARRPP